MTQIGMIRDASVVLTGVSQVVLPLNGSLQYLLIENSTSGPVGINASGPAPSGNAAVIGGAGTYTLMPNDKWPPTGVDFVPQNPINAIGPVGQTLTVTWA